jgi:DNA-binding transcriptional MocR family regulator
VLSRARRQEIAEVARANDLWIVEDDIYGWLLSQPLAPVADFAPERSFFLTSLSKGLAPGLRVGWIRAPQAFIGALGAAVRSTSWMVSPLLGEVAARLLEGGTGRALLEDMRRGVQARHRLARERLGEAWRPHAAPALHGWIPLPERWRAEHFAAEARRRNVWVTSADVFAVDRGPSPSAIRVSLGAPAPAMLARGLGVLAELLRTDPDQSPAVL